MGTGIRGQETRGLEDKGTRRPCEDQEGEVRVAKSSKDVERASYVYIKT